jgi:hypothetical protein
MGLCMTVRPTKLGVPDPRQTVFSVVSPEIVHREVPTPNLHSGFTPERTKISLRLLDLRRIVICRARSPCAKYRLTLGPARQDDLLGLAKDGTVIKPLNLRP